ncbi:MAG: class I SAM-dependent methyltransferase [Micromonosporaceae bacterium]
MLSPGEGPDAARRGASRCAEPAEQLRRPVGVGGGADRVGAGGAVVGLDLNQAMLDVAARVRPDLDWRRGDGAALPFGDASFDLVLCQAALMFFPDRVQALREMARVVRPDGRVAVLVPGRLESGGAYPRLYEVVRRHAGQDALDMLSAYFVLGDLDQLTALCEGAGLRVTETRTRLGAVRRGSIDEFVAAEVYSTPLGERLAADVYQRILAESREALAEYADGAGAAIPIESHTVLTRPAGGRRG